MAAEETKAAATTTTTEFDPAKWLDQVADTMKVNDDAAARQRGLAALNDFIASAAPARPGRLQGRRDQHQVLDRRDRQEAVRPAQRDHAPPGFQKLEGTWRGLHYLVQQTETGETSRSAC